MHGRRFTQRGRTAQGRRRPRPTAQELEKRRRERALLRDRLVADAVQRSGSSEELTYEHISSATGLPLDLLRWAYPNIQVLTSLKECNQGPPTNSRPTAQAQSTGG